MQRGWLKNFNKMAGRTSRSNIERLKEADEKENRRCFIGSIRMLERPSTKKDPLHARSSGRVAKYG